MNPQPLFCLNLACASRGLQNAGNLVLHDGLQERFRCTTCGTTFVSRKGTLFYRLRTDPKIVLCVLLLLAYGCPPQAIVAALGLGERTVKNWQHKAGEHCEQVHQHLGTGQARSLKNRHLSVSAARQARHCAAPPALGGEGLSPYKLSFCGSRSGIKRRAMSSSQGRS